MLDFVKDIAFREQLEKNQHGTMECAREVLIEWFDEVNKSKLVNLISILDFLRRMFMTDDFKNNDELNDHFRSVIFELIAEKQEEGKHSNNLWSKNEEQPRRQSHQQSYRHQLCGYM